MGGCVIPFCNNSTRKGYKLIIIPKNPKRRAEWMENIPNKDFILTNNSRLCEVHFAPEMWINVNCRKKKLKRDAVPTIFGFFLKKQHIENEISSVQDNIENEINSVQDNIENERNSVQDNIEGEINSVQDNIEGEFSSVQDSIKNEISSVQDNIEDEFSSVQDSIKNEISSVQDNIEGEFSSVQDSIKNEISSVQDNIEGEIEEFAKVRNYIEKVLKKYKEKVIKQHTRIITMRRTIKTLRSTIQTLRKKSDNDNNDKYQQALHSIFNKDQINVLIKKSRVQSWTNTTIQRALKLKFSCGVNGYAELLNQGIPLPSIRTLARKQENLKI